MRLIRINGDGTFDLLTSDTETNTSLIRNSTQIRLSYNDNGIIQLIKNNAATSDIGTLLVSNGNVLQPTGDKQSKKTAAKLLAEFSMATETKTVTLANGTTTTAYLLPVQVL